jgi:hypothetical protein
MKLRIGSDRTFAAACGGNFHSEAWRRILSMMPIDVRSLACVLKKGRGLASADRRLPSCAGKFQTRSRKSEDVAPL